MVCELCANNLNIDQLFLTSPRNSAAAHRSLFEALKCQTLVTTNAVPPSAQMIIQAVQPHQLIIPSVDELLSETYSMVAYNVSFKDALVDPLMVMYVIDG